MIEKRPFGNTGVDVSVIGFGGGAVSGEGGGYGFGDISDRDADRLLLAAFDAGINLFDTAPIYGFGLSERRIGKTFRERRDDVFLVSKAGVTWNEQKQVRTSNDPQVVSRMLEQSLVDLGVERIDLYMIHWPDLRVDIRAPMQVLANAKKDGKIRFIGLCNTFPEDLRKAQEVAPVDVVQNEYNLFTRQAETDLFPLLDEQRIGFMSYGTLDKGILTGRVRRGRTYDQSDVRAKAPWWREKQLAPKFDAMERIDPMLANVGHSGLELALGFVLSHSTVSTALCGIRNETQLASAVAALGHPPDDGVLGQARAIVEDALQRPAS